MSPAELIHEIERKLALGHEWIQLTIRRKTSPKNWDRVRVVPGVYGRCITDTIPGAILVDVPLSDLARVLGVTVPSPSLPTEDK